jgi:hypothetical protein
MLRTKIAEKKETQVLYSKYFSRKSTGFEINIKELPRIVYISKFACL